MPAPIAVQLFSLRNEMQHDFAGVIHTLAETGYVGVEPCQGLPDTLDEATKAQIIHDCGLGVCSLHVAPPLDDDEAKVIAAAGAYGAQCLVLAYYDDTAFRSVEGIQKACNFINRCSQAAARHGLEFGYHNHNAELQLVQGR